MTSLNKVIRKHYTKKLLEAIQKTPIDLIKIKKYIKKGADTNVKTNFLGETVLHWASRIGDAEIVKLLLEKGADVKAKDAVGYTALKNAKLSDHKPVIKILLDYGADIREIYDHSILNSLTASEKEKTIALFLKNYIPLYEPFIWLTLLQLLRQKSCNERAMLPEMLGHISEYISPKLNMVNWEKRTGFFKYIVAKNKQISDRIQKEKNSKKLTNTKSFLFYRQSSTHTENAQQASQKNNHRKSF